MAYMTHDEADAVVTLFSEAGFAAGVIPGTASNRYIVELLRFPVGGGVESTIIHKPQDARDYIAAHAPVADDAACDGYDEA